MKWIKENWMLCILIFIVIWLVIFAFKSCGISKADKAALKESSKEIADLKAQNSEKDEEISKALEMVKKADKVVKLKEEELRQKESRIRKLMAEEREVVIGLTELPPSEVVQKTIEILKVATEEVTLTDQGILFTEDAGRKNLEALITGEFSFAAKQRDEFSLALDDCKEALQFEKIAALNLTEAALKQAEQIQNLNLILGEKDNQIRIYKKKRMVGNFFKGAVFGIVATITVVIFTNIGEKGKGRYLF